MLRIISHFIPIKDMGMGIFSHRRSLISTPESERTIRLSNMKGSKISKSVDVDDWSVTFGESLRGWHLNTKK
jgi:hypothetical protein